MGAARPPAIAAMFSWPRHLAWRCLASHAVDVGRATWRSRPSCCACLTLSESPRLTRAARLDRTSRIVLSSLESAERIRNPELAEPERARSFTERTFGTGAVRSRLDWLYEYNASGVSIWWPAQLLRRNGIRVTLRATRAARAKQGGMSAHSDPRVGRARIVDHDLAHQLARQPFGQHGVAVELPVRIVGGEQQHLVRSHVVHQPLEHLRRRRPVAWRDGQPHVARARCRSARDPPTAPPCAGRARIWSAAIDARAAR